MTAKPNAKKNILSLFLIIILFLSGCIDSNKEKSEEIQKEIVRNVVNSTIDNTRSTTDQFASLLIQSINIKNGQMFIRVENTGTVKFLCDDLKIQIDEKITEYTGCNNTFVSGDVKNFEISNEVFSRGMSKTVLITYKGIEKSEYLCNITDKEYC